MTTFAPEVQAPGEVRRQVSHLNEDYAFTLDDLNVTEWASYFTEDAVYQVISRENHDAGLAHSTIFCNGGAMIRDRALAIMETTVQAERSLKHFVSAPRIHSIENGVVVAEARFMVVESLYDQEPHLALVGRYLDEVVYTELGEMKYQRRICVYDNWRVRTTLIYPV